jgi:phosphatidate cytidylyltransferase
LNNFFKRTLTAGGFVAVLLLSTWYSQWTFSLLFFLITILGTWEFYTLSEKDAQPQKISGTLLAAFIFAASSMVCMGYPAAILVILLPLCFIVFMAELFTKSAHPFRNIAFTFLGIIYVAVPFSLLNYLLTLDSKYNFEILFGLWLILWSNDTGAYLAGSAFGKNKLFPRVSPGKSWEGCIGGAIAAFVVAWIISGWYESIRTCDWFVIAGILVVAGTLGDLVESLLKRSINVKDSGTLLPGHGGILDRFDSLLMATPFVFSYLYLVKHLTF